MNEMIKVGMADLNACKCPNALTTLGLGSCVGIALYDPSVKVGGMAHIMLPDSTKIRKNENPAKFADTGIDELIKLMVSLGAKKQNLVAKIAGGAQMFAFTANNDMLRIGDRNVEATKAKLASLGIRVIGEDTGLNYGRTIEFYTETGDLLIKSVGKPIKTI
ncbi:chemotaxis protein CheD [Anaerosporobacter sp.]